MFLLTTVTDSGFQNVRYDTRDLSLVVVAWFVRLDDWDVEIVPKSTCFDGELRLMRKKPRCSVNITSLIE